MAMIKINQAMHQDADLGPFLGGMGVTPDFSAQQIQAAAQQGPQAIAGLLSRASTEAGKFAELNKPQVISTHAGNRHVISTVEPMSGTRRVVGTENVELSPHEQAQLAISRGQLAVAQGNLRNSQDRLRFEKDNPGIEVKEQSDGTFIGINKRTGVSTPITSSTGGTISAAPKPLNESQGASVAYGMRMAQADKTLKKIEDTGLKDTGLIRSGVSGTVGMVPLIGESLSAGVDNVFNVLPGIMGGLSPEQQKTLQARINFITAVLRKESGASISPTEFATAEKNYFPAPGDSADVIKQKQETRQTAIKAMKVQAGPGASQIDKAISVLPTTSNKSADGWEIVR